MYKIEKNNKRGQTLPRNRIVTSHEKTWSTYLGYRGPGLAEAEDQRQGNRTVEPS